ncbi:Eukaryotic translation initiation factor 3 subunit K [Chelonia mydas]|uniref:Eukaryotic translation initiation factor 3 subunit K n=1 Tax=Chelonia mydas TaxID=8469 RepID=M7AXR2_CHEMY|nr:Eukaryotic translation initiation factor 3 subunit K [Chelonia mydas]
MRNACRRSSPALPQRGMHFSAGYNPENLATLERYVETQAKENAYDLEANLAVLKLYQFNPAFFQTTVTAQILLKALTNLPHTDFTLCKCMIDQAHQEERPIRQILYLGELLETCHFQAFWQALDENMELLDGITGFEDSVRKFICHVVGITYQHIDRWLLAEVLGDLSDNQLKVWMSKYGWTETESGKIFICNQEESIKPKNIVEKIDFDTLNVGTWGCLALGVVVGAAGRTPGVPGVRGAVCDAPDINARYRQLSEGKPYAANEMKLVLGTTLVLRALRLPACCAQCNPEGGSSAPRQVRLAPSGFAGASVSCCNVESSSCCFPRPPPLQGSRHRLGPIHSLSLDHKMLPSLFANGGAGSENTQLVNPGLRLTNKEGSRSDVCACAGHQGSSHDGG